MDQAFKCAAGVFGGCAAIVALVILMCCTQNDFLRWMRHPAQAFSNGVRRQGFADRTAAATGHQLTQSGEPACTCFKREQLYRFLTEIA